MNATTHRERVGSFQVRVEHQGADASPVSDGAECDHFAIQVISEEGDLYACDGTGSVADHDRGVPVEDQAREMVSCVLDDLLSAANDPDEFWSMATDGLKVSTPDGKRGVENVLALLEYASDHSAAIFELCDVIEERRA